jgi:xylulokinase
MNNLFLGFDCSTQSFKVIIIDISGTVIYQDKIIFNELNNLNNLTENKFQGIKDGIIQDGNIGFYYDLPEITPHGLIGDFRFDVSGNPIAKFDREIECRALIEGQCSSMLKYSQKLGIKTDKIVVSGGASVNKEILKIISSIFNCGIDTSTNYETSLIGSAYRAIHGFRCL